MLLATAALTAAGLGAAVLGLPATARAAGVPAAASPSPPGATPSATPATPPAAAPTGPPALPGAAPTASVDPHAPGLRLAPGATLAPPEVLDIVSVVGDPDGTERRSDSNAGVDFDLEAEVLFQENSATLSPDAGSRIEAVADEIIQQGATTVRVFGFTDDLGTHAHGLVLSKQRAEAVYAALVKDLPDTGAIQFEVRGYAEEYPVASNATEAGREQNRRVEISFAKGAGG